MSSSWCSLTVILQNAPWCSIRRRSVARQHQITNIIQTSLAVVEGSRMWTSMCDPHMEHKRDRRMSYIWAATSLKWLLKSSIAATSEWLSNNIHFLLLHMWWKTKNVFTSTYWIYHHKLVNFKIGQEEPSTVRLKISDIMYNNGVKSISESKNSNSIKKMNDRKHCIQRIVHWTL